MPRYVAFLRGVSPLNAKMPDLKAAFEAVGFSNVRTVLSSGNVIFSSRAASLTTLERRAETAMTEALDQSFLTIIRSVDALENMIASDPFTAFKLSQGSKRVVTFFKRPPTSETDLPIEFHGAMIHGAGKSEAFSTYIEGPRGPAFMALIERTFGRDVTTRTWDTVKKCVKA